MFEKSASYYDALYSWKNYEAEVAKLHELIQRHLPGAATVLDVACGTGKHIELLRRDYEVEGVDLDANLLEIAQRRNPEAVLYAGDMIELELGRRYDVVVCLFSSIGYVQTKENLGRATHSMAKHVAPGGLLIIEPWLAPDIYEEGHVGLLVVDEPEIKIARMNATRRSGDISVLDFHYLVGTPEGTEHFTETHRMGLFTEIDHLEAIRGAGLEPLPASDLMGRGLYVARRAA